MSGTILDTNSFYDTEVTSLNKLVVDTLVFEKRNGTQLDMLTVLTNEISGTTVSTFNLNDYVISSAVMNTQLADSNLFDTTEDMQIDTMVVNGSTDSTIDHKLGVSGFSLFSEDGSGFFNATTASSTSGVVDSSGGLRGVVNVSREIYLKDGNGDYIQLGLAVYALIGLLPMTEYASGGGVIRKSLHSFNFTMEDVQVDIPVTIALEDYVPDFIIENITNDASGAFQFNFNDFAIDIGVDSSGSFVKSLGAFSVVFDVNTDTLIKVTPVSPRAKEYQDTWCEETSHNIHTLFKGLFGQMLVNSGIVPVEVTQNSSGAQGEAFTGFITDDSLERNVVPKFDGWVSNTDGSGSSSFFEQEHDQIITNLQTSFRDIWTNDNNAEWYANLYNSTTSGPIFTAGDTFSVPMEISMRYKIQSDNNEPDHTGGLKGNTNLDAMAVSITNIVTSASAEAEETWRFIYKFNVQDASGSVTTLNTGTAAAGQKVNYTVTFKELGTNNVLHVNSTKTDSNGYFTADNFSSNSNLVKVVVSNEDGSGNDALTLEYDTTDILTGVYDTTAGSFMVTPLTSLIAESFTGTVTSEQLATKKSEFETKLGLSAGALDINPYDSETSDSDLSSLTAVTTFIDTIQSTIALSMQASGITDAEKQERIRNSLSVSIESNSSIDFTDSSFITNVVDTAATKISEVASVTIDETKKNEVVTGLNAITTAIQTAVNDGGSPADLVLKLHERKKQIKTALTTGTPVASITPTDIENVVVTIATEVNITAPPSTGGISLSGLVARWDGTFENGLVKDLVGTRDLTPTSGGAIGTDATYGSYFSLDSDRTYQMAGHFGGVLSNQFTMSYWYNPTDITRNWQALLNNFGNVHREGEHANKCLYTALQTTNNNSLGYGIGAAAFVGAVTKGPTISLANGQWIMITFIWDGSEVKVYEGETEIVGNTQSEPTNIYFGDQRTWYIGRQHEGYTSNGKIGSLIVLDTAHPIEDVVSYHTALINGA